MNIHFLNIFVSLVIIFFTIYAKVENDYKIWYNLVNKLSTKVIDHITEGALVIFISTAPALLLAAETTLPLIKGLLFCLLMIFFIIWTLFDGFFNLKRNLKWWFNGTVYKGSSLLNKVLQSMPLLLQKIIKFGGIIATVTYYILKLKFI